MNLSVLLSAVSIGAAVLLSARPGSARLRRVASATADGGPVRPGEAVGGARQTMPVGTTRTGEASGSTRSRPTAGQRWRRWCAAGAAGAVVVVVLGGVTGALTGLGVVVAAGRLLGRREASQQKARRRALAADLPLAADLLAACLRAGQPPDRALGVVADALDGPLGSELGVVAANLRMGADPSAAWADLRAEPVLAPLARAMARSADSGAPVAAWLDDLADDARRAARMHAVQNARTVGVRAVLPLGLCFLPAFVLLGVVPVVAGAVGALLR